MRIAILSRGDGWHVRDLLRAARDAGHVAESLDFRRLNSHQSLPNYDTLLIRTMPAGSLEQVVFRMDLLHAAEAQGVKVINPPRALETCVDKYLTNVRLEAAGLSVPRTIVCQLAEDAMSAFEILGQDVVVKPLFGSEGRGMVRVTDAEVAWRTFHALEQLQAVMYVQAFIRHPGFDVRVFTLRGRTIAAMKRWSRHDWRTNVAQGGRAEKHYVSSVECELACRAAESTGAIIAGVDLMHDDQGLLRILEVNAAPGWQALAAVCDLDIAARIIQDIGDP